MNRTKTSCSLAVCLARAIFTLALFPKPSLGATLTAGAGKMYSTVRAAAAAAQNGDLVLIDAGTYLNDVCLWSASNLTVRGVGPGRSYIKATNGTNYGDKGNWVISGQNFTAENIEFSGGFSSSTNGAGMRFDISGDITIRNCFFHDNHNGILGGCGNLLVENSIFEHNGYGDGQSHNMYVWGNTFTLRNSSRGNGAQFANPGGYDYHLTSASPALILNAAGLPGLSATGYNLMPTMQYVYDAQGTTRTPLGILDVGAFEYGSGSGGADVTSPSAVTDLRNR